MAQMNDERIMQLKGKVEKKRKELSEMQKNVTTQTNCNLIIGRDIIQINVASTPFLLVRLNAYAMSAKDLGMSPDDITISGFSLSKWIHDVKGFLAVEEYRKEKRNLDTLEKQLDNLLSADKRTELEIDKIASLLD